MPSFLMLTKKPTALPVLKGTAEGWNHLDPVEIVTSDEALRDVPHCNYIPKLDAAMIRGTGAYRHHVWQELEGRIDKATCEEFFRAPTILTAKGVPTARRVYTLDTRAVDAKAVASLGNREADSVIEKPVALATLLKARM